MAGLASVLGVAPPDVVVVDHRPSLYSTSAACQIVTCSLADGSEHPLLVKRETPSRGHGHGYWGGVAYEAMVYREVLGPLGIRTPRLYGTFVDRTGAVSAVFSYLADTLRAGSDPEQRALVRAAGWIGRFHVRAATLGDRGRRRLTRYGAEYYASWPARALRLAGNRLDEGWIAPLCRNARSALAELLDEPPTVVHGEYYPSNILFRGEDTYPVDWETAAVASGEIDLAALTDGWPEEMTRACEEAYVRARWPSGPPTGFGRTLDLARLYLHLRWLGDRPEWTTDERSAGRYERLRAAGERLGLVDPVGDGRPR